MAYPLHVSCLSLFACRIGGYCEISFSVHVFWGSRATHAEDPGQLSDGVVKLQWRDKQVFLHDVLKMI